MPVDRNLVSCQLDSTLGRIVATSIVPSARRSDLNLPTVQSRSGPAEVGFPVGVARVEIVVPAWQVGGEAIRLSATVCFVDGREDLALLGLVGFFDHFVLKIDDAAQQLWWRRRR
jgi:hypothetical protein